MVFLLLAVLSLSFAQVRILSTETNEGAFAVRDLGDHLCFVGRRDSGGDGYDALLGVCGSGCRTYLLSSPSDDYSYTVEEHGRLCVAGITSLARGNMDFVLALFGEGGVEEVLSFGGRGNDMLWFMRKVKGGYVLVGGVQNSDWDILVVKLSEELRPLWVKRFGTRSEEYAYGMVEAGGKYYVVGRSRYRGNWDAFILELSPEGRLLSARLFGSDRKDYLRYVGLFRGEPLAVGRSEALGDSDVLLLIPRSGLYRLYDGGEFDYGRVFRERRDGVVLMGDTYYDGASDGLLLFLDGKLNPVESFAIGGEDVESVRYLDGSYFAGYTYSFTLDNDVLLGSITGVCRGLVRKKEFHERKAVLEFYPYPLKERAYSFHSLDLKITVKTLKLKELEPCQE